MTLVVFRARNRLTVLLECQAQALRWAGLVIGSGRGQRTHVVELENTTKIAHGEEQC